MVPRSPFAERSRLCLSRGGFQKDDPLPQTGQGAGEQIPCVSPLVVGLSVDVHHRGQPLIA